MSRTCGTCSQCCKTLGIDELKKPPSVWCPHAEIKKGCKIYDDRPHSCRIFNCLWLKDERLPDAMRPDKTKVVLHFQPEEKRLKANVDPDRSDAWQEGLTGAYLRMVQRAGVDVLIVCGTKKNLRTAYEREETANGERLLPD
jgi:hypothetical protein